MRPFYIVFLFISLIGLTTQTAIGQIRANFVEGNTISSYELEAYRNSIWRNPPSAEGFTNDFEGIFTLDQEEQLSEMIGKLAQSTGIEIAIVTVDTIMLDVSKFDEFADHLLSTWGVGKKQEEKGIVICISSQYKKLTISRGVGIDKYVNDAFIKALIAKTFVPYYKKHDYFTGTLNGLVVLINRLNPPKQ